MTTVICPLEELRETLVKMRTNYRTPHQLDQMKTSVLVQRISAFVGELMQCKAMEARIDGLKEEEPEVYNVCVQMLQVTEKDLEMACHALDCRIPVPSD